MASLVPEREARRCSAGDSRRRSRKARRSRASSASEDSRLLPSRSSRPGTTGTRRFLHPVTMAEPVIATFDSGAGAQARAIARGLRVLTVGQAPEGLDRASASIPVTVALSNPSLAAGLALGTRREDRHSSGGGSGSTARSRRRASREARRLERLPVVLALTPMAERAIEHLLFGRDAVIEPRASASEADELDHEVPVAAAAAVLVSPDLFGLTPRTAPVPGLRRPRCRSRQGLPGAAGATRARRR